VALPTRGAVGAFLALGAAMPGLLVLDMTRYLGFAAGNAARAAVLDIVWLVVQVGVIVALIRAGPDTLMSLMMLAWEWAVGTAALMDIARTAVCRGSSGDHLTPVQLRPALPRRVPVDVPVSTRAPCSWAASWWRSAHWASCAPPT
jgi:hypothetical protein